MRSSAPAGAPAVALHYARHVGWSGAILAEFAAHSESSVIVTFNYDARPMIGLWRSELPDKTFRRLLSDVRRANLSQLATGDDFPPEAKFITLGVRSAGETLPAVNVFDVRAVPAAVQALAKQCEHVIDDIRRGPVRVLEASARFAQASIDAWSRLSVSMTIKNIGQLPAAVSNPLATPAGAATGVQLYLRSARDPAAEQGVEIEVQQLRAAPGSPGGDVITLGPAQEFTFELHKQVYLAPGTYTGALSFQNQADPAADPQVVEGSLWLELGTLTVTRPRSLR